jgi:hypothetical protein
MSAPASVAQRLPGRFQGRGPKDTTLLDLVGAVAEVAEDENEVVATVLHMIRSGRVRLCGNFRGLEREFS